MQSVFISTIFLCLILITDARDELEQFSNDIKQTADLIRVKLKGITELNFVFVYFSAEFI